MKKLTWMLLGLGLSFALVMPASAESKSKWDWNSPDSVIWFSASAEAGFLAILDHKIQFGSKGTYFDYVADGGQDNLFLFLRLSLDVTIKKSHTLTFLYQPLNVQSQSALRTQIQQDATTFNKGEPMNFRYGFDFYRLSYTYDIFPEQERELSFGVSLQIRNATIIFTNEAGTKRAYRNDIGPVPILKSRGYFPISPRFWFGFEVDGFYAPIRFLNGGTTDVEGAILDASVRFGYRLLKNVDIFLNVRYIGGGGQGTSGNASETGSDGYVANWLHTLAVSVGASLR